METKPPLRLQTSPAKLEGHKQEKVDLISDVVKFVAELNESRYEGDTILITLQRLLSSSFVEKSEYAKEMDRVLKRQDLDLLHRNFDRLNTTVDKIDIKVNKLESFIDDIQKDVRNLQFEVNRKSDKTEFKILKETMKSLPREDEIKMIRSKLLKTASLDDLYDVKSRMSIVNEKMEEFMTKKFFSKGMHNVKKDLDVKISQFISKRDAIKIVDKKSHKLLDKLQDIDIEIRKIPQAFQSIDGMKSHLKNTVLKRDFADEKKKVDEFISEMRSKCLLKPHLESHKSEIQSFVQTCYEKLQEYTKDNKQAKMILRNFDEVLIEKASKFSIEELQLKIKELANTEQVNELKQYFNFKLQDTNIVIDKLREHVNENKNDVLGIISRETESIQKHLKEKIKEYLLSKTISPEEVQMMLSNKVDKNEIVEVKENKADKSQIQNGEEKHKLFAKQMQHLSVLIIELAKIASLDLDPNSPLLSNAKYLLQQSHKVFDWIKCFSKKSAPEPNLLDIKRNTEDGSLIKVRSIITKKMLKSTQNSPRKDELFHSFRSNSSRRCLHKEGEVQLFKDMADHPIVKAKKKMVYRSKRKESKDFLNLSKFKVSMTQNLFSQRSESVNLRKRPYVNIKSESKRFRSKKLDNTDEEDFLNSFSNLKRSLKNELGI
ncbi:unnamed protein product [Moneuplotes crassus]|uniref:Uncharacterized protein n=1 Tax=Euplotes crassus TaxID=5936 RepID=A0AAD1Y730_EUPCR|nr:unnamed protein product [Moneuplotes crassus]